MRKTSVLLPLLCSLVFCSQMWGAPTPLRGTTSRDKVTKARRCANRIYLTPQDIMVDDSGITVMVQGSAFKASGIHCDTQGLYIQCGDLTPSPIEKKKKYRQNSNYPDAGKGKCRDRLTCSHCIRRHSHRYESRVMHDHNEYNYCIDRMRPRDY